MPKKSKKPRYSVNNEAFKLLAERTGLEPATPGVTGRYSNQLNYHSAVVVAFACLFNLALDALCSTLKPSATKLGDPTGIRTPVLTVKG